MAWFLLLIAGVLEVVWAAGLKYWSGAAAADPHRNLVIATTVFSLIASFGLLGLAMQSIPLGTAYAVWTGIGTLGGVLVGVVYFSEPASFPRLGFAALILIGIFGLRFAR